MNSREEIAIIDMLRQREAEFVKIWQCEEGIRRVLGLSSYPFDLPVELPSRAKGKRTVKACSQPETHRAKNSAPQLPAPSCLRKLVTGEDAYRVVFEHHGEVQTSVHTDLELLKRLFGLCGEGFQLRSVETVAYHGNDDCDSVAVLWHS